MGARPHLTGRRRGLPGLALALVLAAAAPAAAAPPPANPLHGPMMAAASVMQAASRLLYAERAARGLLPPPDADPNRTGMIGFEYTGMTTEQGELPAKRTVTSPDFAAALVKLIGGLGLAEGTPVVVSLSGSYIGGDVAMLAALEALHLRPVVVVSAGTSQWGANNPEFTILDMLALLRDRGLIATSVVATAIGGPDGAGSGMDDQSIALIRASAARNGVPLVEAHPLAAVVDGLVAAATAALAGGTPGAVINVGGAVVGPGTCRESFNFPSGLTTTPVPCTAGTPGVLMRFSAPGRPVIHILNMMHLAEAFGLPFDPIPLPTPGDNAVLYGRPAPAGAR
jgi:poly-gamma-glutamate system protein